MRTLKRNQRKVYYADRIKTEVVKDEYGNPTGEHRVIYGTPQPLWVNVSAAKGEYLLRQFGELENYDRALTMGSSHPLTEQSVLWIDHNDISKPHDYRVTRIAESLNSTVVLVKKVSVGG